MWRDIQFFLEFDNNMYNSEKIRLRKIMVDAFPWCHIVSCVTLNALCHPAHIGSFSRSLIQPLDQCTGCQFLGPLYVAQSIRVLNQLKVCGGFISTYIKKKGHGFIHIFLFEQFPWLFLAVSLLIWICFLVYLKHFSGLCGAFLMCISHAIVWP